MTHPADPASAFAGLPQTPYYAVIFSSQRNPGDDGYAAMADRMVALAAGQPGYLGMETAREASGFGITVSYWRSLEDIAAWRRHAEHRVAQETGRTHWYGRFELRVAQVLRAHAGGTDPG